MILAEVPSAVKAALSLCVLSEHYHLLTQEHTESWSPYRQYWRYMTGREREVKMVCIAQSHWSQRERKETRKWNGSLPVTQFVLFSYASCHM